MKLSGKVSSFGGPSDSGVSASEDLALYWEESQIAEHPELFLPEQPPGTTGLARRLDPSKPYLALRWSYEGYTKDELRDALFMIFAPGTGRSALARAVDWGPHEDTNRIADISPGLMDELGIQTDDVVEVFWPVADIEKPQRALAIAISSGHSTKCPGAVSLINEVEEATRVVDELGRVLWSCGFTVHTFHDTVSTTQQENLERICDWHNSKKRDLDVSVHFNANVETTSPMGTECLYVSQETLAANIAASVADAGGLKNRGAKFRSDLYVLNHTDMPCVLCEICFVDSSADVDAYQQNFKAICRAIGTAIAEGIPIA